MKYTVTIAMPIYNVAPYVEKSLLSALNQTFVDIEYLLVDDKGTDESMDIVHRIISMHPRGKNVRIIDQKYNQGTAAARNVMVANATGEYLFIMDSDDVISPDCIDILYQKMKQYSVDFIAGSFQRQTWDGDIYPGGYRYKDTLIKDGTFSLPGKKALLKSDASYEIILIDATETPVERPQKNKENTIPERKKDIH